MRDGRALAFIILHLRDNVIIHVSHAKTSKQAWDILVETFESQDVKTTLDLRSLIGQLDAVGSAVGKSEAKPSKKKGKCNYSKKEGHYIKEWRKKIPNEKKEAEAHVASTSEHEKLFSATMSSTCQYTAEGSHWYIDSGATQPLTSQKEWFSSLNEVPHEVPQKRIKIGNDKKTWRRKDAERSLNGAGATPGICMASQSTVLPVPVPTSKEVEAHVASTSEHEKTATMFSTCRYTGEGFHWYIHSGATQHMTSQKEWFSSLNEVPQKWIKIGSDKKTYRRKAAERSLSGAGATPGICVASPVPASKETAVCTSAQLTAIFTEKYAAYAVSPSPSSLPIPRFLKFPEQRSHTLQVASCEEFEEFSLSTFASTPCPSHESPSSMYSYLDQKSRANSVDTATATKHL
ncbi:hypothetical protein O6H91_17G068300 [Diphasiastrum complanatum]|uniref:Uncharacterized protein n=1 Tax=Diphasiastrum complanatum TaxID=34168 RepID=A0ACC2B7U8_DIPCM|nr:hypothetical protein O6H91_Y198500 [Diphasiastrum complanatum]KAJ7525820.1 hypothetical protein O6H91_17G068300 [Diphasiastrum complanatum]